MINPPPDSHTDIQQFTQLCRQTTSAVDYPNATSVEQNVLIYDGDRLRNQIDQPQQEQSLLHEFARCLSTGPGVFLVRGAYADVSTVTRSTEILRHIVTSEKSAGSAPADHFGNNERIWNSLQKACIADPELFVDYFGNDLLHLASQAWLGPNYRITAQMNNVKPGGKEQTAHRDYHLGFQSTDTVAKFPLHAQVASQYLTLQGAIAHVDMTVDHGPTLLLPFSQQYEAGYLAHELPEFRDFFTEHRVQLPLSTGDMLFFNPALFHAGGANVTGEDRIANLIQVSSAMGRTMETLNHQSMIEAVFPIMLANKSRTSARRLRNIITTVTDGYAFPTNLDSDPPIDGNAPATECDLVTQAVDEGWTLEKLQSALADNANRRMA